MPRHLCSRKSFQSFPSQWFHRCWRPHLADLSNKKLSPPTFLIASMFQKSGTNFSSSAYLCTSDFAVFMRFVPGCHFGKNITRPPTSHHMEASYCIVPPGTWILHLEVQLHLHHNLHCTKYLSPPRYRLPLTGAYYGVRGGGVGPL